MKKTELLPYAREDGRCHDCSCLPGEKHYEGCDVDECPICHEQSLGCEHGQTYINNRIPFGDERI